MDVPAETPARLPEETPIMAAVVLELVHVPPVIKSFSRFEVPAHSVVVPVMGAGVTFTVTSADVRQPVASVYVIMAVPGDAPVSVPEPAPIVATTVLLLLQVPVPVRSVRLVDDPWHTCEAPPIVAGSGFTTTVATAVHPPVII